MAGSETVVGIIGGTGLYGLEGIDVIETREVDTPYGSPSSPVVLARHDDVQVLFLARHGLQHSILPSEINYAANIFALKSLGAQWCVSVSAVGSLQEEHRPGDIVLPTQYIDRTKSRRHTLYGDGVVVHVPFANPVCPVLHQLLEQSCRTVLSHGAPSDSDRRIAASGTYVCMEGPVFSTRAESQWYRSMGAAVIGMTALPEAKFAREAEISYATMATVTDYDCWRSETADIDIPELLATMRSNVLFVKQVLASLLPLIAAAQQPESVSQALATSLLTPASAIPAARRDALRPLLGRYLEQ